LFTDIFSSFDLQYHAHWVGPGQVVGSGRAGSGGQVGSSPVGLSGRVGSGRVRSRRVIGLGCWVRSGQVGSIQVGSLVWFGLDWVRLGCWVWSGSVRLGPWVRSSDWAGSLGRAGLGCQAVAREMVMTMLRAMHVLTSSLT
jgi:hypothetical protein